MKRSLPRAACAACAALFALPQGAENAVWSVMEEEGKSPLVQCSFAVNGQALTARAQEGAAAEDDISGMYYEWTSTEPAEVSAGGKTDLPGMVYAASGDKESAQLITWYDDEAKTLYSLGAVGEDLDGFDIEALAEEM